MSWHRCTKPRSTTACGPQHQPCSKKLADRRATCSSPATGCPRTTSRSSLRDSASAESATRSGNASISRSTIPWTNTCRVCISCPTADWSRSPPCTPMRRRKTSLVYNEALPHVEARNGLTVRLDGPHGTHIAWSIADPIDADGWSSARVETIESLLPNLRQYVRVRQALVDARALGSSLAALLENTRCGVIQMDRFGRIVAANDRARNLLRKRDGLFDRRGLLSAASPEENVTLQGLLARALPLLGGQCASGSMMVTRSVVLPRLAVHISPVGERRSDQHPVRVAALALVVDPTDRAQVDPDLVAVALGLTPAESGVAGAAGPGKHHPRHCPCDGPQPRHGPLARQAYLHQAEHLTAIRAGSDGAVPRQHSGDSALIS